jgi:hypothetical protein
MEPIHPALREELKRAHPGLTDADIDRYEELTSLRFTLDPDAAREEIRQLDAERMQIVRAKMPQLGELENAFIARARAAATRVKPAPRIETIRSPDETKR